MEVSPEATNCIGADRTGVRVVSHTMLKSYASLRTSQCPAEIPWGDRLVWQSASLGARWGDGLPRQ